MTFHINTEQDYEVRLAKLMEGVIAGELVTDTHPLGAYISEPTDQLVDWTVIDGQMVVFYRRRT